MQLEQFLDRWLNKAGGAERANYQLFLSELCETLDLPRPDPATGGLLSDFQFEGPVSSAAAFGTKGTHRIDLYKRDAFILEAKQSQLGLHETPPDEPESPPLETLYDLFGNPVGTRTADGKPARRYDRLMAEARVQAERYALGLPEDHIAPPFLLVCDVGRAFELYFDWSTQGRGYRFFPDQQSYRIRLEELRDPKRRDLLRAIWTDPRSVDPRARSAEMTRAIATRLSRVAAQLEKDQRDANPGDTEIALGIEQTSLFLMRLIFCMFAEDVELLPRDSFKRFLADAKERSAQFWHSGLTDLWSKMNAADAANRYWSFGDALVRYFNGNLFAHTRIYDLPLEFKNELLVAAGQDWRAVEPAIFGTLLEQVLTRGDRARFGAHYTPRVYVERLVDATIMDVLQPEWEAVRSTARAAAEAGEVAAARGALAAFHDRLAGTRVLDPACGTGNFLYVAMERLQLVESELIELAAGLGATLEPRIHPNQFLGLELNPRAAVIAELVLWIGWLRRRLADHPDAIGEPVLPRLTNINFGTHGGYDAVLARTATGEPDAENPHAPAWPEAEFIVGNPPFIGGKDLRSRLGGDYAETLWRANPRVPRSADFVMQWWDRAAHILVAEGSPLRRFGFVTTNSITQEFSRRVIARYLSSSPGRGGGPAKPVEGGPSQARTAQVTPAAGEAADIVATETPLHQPSAGPPPHPGEDYLSLVLAVPDHPWTRATKDAAAVRIAMTVAELGAHAGRLVEVVREAALDTDAPVIETNETVGTINADLTAGTNVTAAKPLKANEGLASPGVKLHGAGFIVTPAEAAQLGLGRREGLEAHIRPYRHGRDLLQRPRGAMVIDLLGLTEKETRERYHEVYQHLLLSVFEEHDKEGKLIPGEGRKYNARKSYRDFWWLHGEPRKDMRPALAGLTRYIATVETSKHRLFQFLDGGILPDNMLIAIGSDDAFHLGVLSSSIHVEWVLRLGGWLGVGNDSRYSKSRAFDPFPFPDPSPEQRAKIAELAEELDATRKRAIAEVPRLTMTELYNLRAKLRANTATPAERERAVAARAGIVDRLHEQIDAAVADVYGWGAEWRVAPLPPAEIVARLVALNAARAAEEAAGQVRWLRPDYQEPRFGRGR